MNYDEAFERVLGHEGELSLDRDDRGNWTSGEVGKGQLKGTKYGISAMSYPTMDIANLTKEQAKQIYYVDFWMRVKGEKLHNALAFQLFDAAINHGPGNAIRMVQRAVSVADDGVVGPLTLDAIKNRGIDDTLKLFNAERIDFFTKISTFNKYGRGWMRRVANNLRYAADDYTAPWNEHVEVARA